MREVITTLYLALVGPHLGHSGDLNTRQTLITWSKLSGEPPGWSEAGEPALGEEAEGHRLVQIEKEPMSSLPSTYREVTETMEPGFLQWYMTG